MESKGNKQFEIVFHRQAEKTLDGLTGSLRKRLLIAIDRLSQEPRPQGCILLKIERRYRIRVGDWRVVYEIHDGILRVLVIRIAHRRDVYD
ncbi:MAG: type II toxin-antitoxin system RelE/ParE family toxin [Synergistaceae bacterium]|nr:type II toxin-antitoxin system RelE/ParE family toxin [Synergistaceae bacterium]